jgi:protein-tyrosine-phosphatase
MTQSHARATSALAAPLTPTPAGNGRIVQTLDPDGHDVPDPIGSPASVYRSTAQALHRLIAKRFAHLQATQTQHANDQTNDTEART